MTNLTLSDSGRLSVTIGPGQAQIRAEVGAALRLRTH